jgi:hypothetical protein
MPLSDGLVSRLEPSVAVQESPSSGECRVQEPVPPCSPPCTCVTRT